MNDRKLKEIKSKGPATIEQLCKINSNIDNCKERLDFIETSAQRPEISTDFNTGDKYFSDYIRKGMENRLSHKTLSEDDNDIGGYLVIPHIVKRINKRVTDSSPMRQIYSNQRISTKTLDYIIEDCDRSGAGWSSEVAYDEDGSYKSKYDFA
ncbi:phage major capsid protein [Wolbachia endosymbiont of Trichogramma pretiosum]|uniref:phage major capsid protein n=1 Tax=Wolbachia endosymbiont of Trichogramma pretiosum TaxID=125593 RepID=UPI00210FFEB7|nr:phage major capsid protein [Wolbachia endosymbiont of Trichogramma pretiosum]